MSLCSCADSKIATQTELLQYAKEQYGESELIDCQTDGKERITCYLRDNEYGFEYYVESYMNGVGMDASVFYYTEAKKSDFRDMYYQSLIPKIESGMSDIEVRYNVTAKLVTPYDKELNAAQMITSESNSEQAKKAANEAIDLFKKYDTRGYWDNIKCKVYNTDEELLFTCDTNNRDGYTVEDEEIHYYTLRAREYNNDAVYVRHESVPFKDTGISKDDIMNTMGVELPTDETLVTYYYFCADDKEFFLADVCLEDDETGWFGWFNNYYEVFPEDKKTDE